MKPTKQEHDSAPARFVPPTRAKPFAVIQWPVKGRSGGRAGNTNEAEIVRLVIDELLESQSPEAPLIMTIAAVKGLTKQLSPDIIAAAAPLIRATARYAATAHAEVLIAVGEVILALHGRSGTVSVTATQRTHVREDTHNDAEQVSESLVEKFNHTLAISIDALPNDYPVRRQALSALQAASRSAIAHALGSAINQYAATLPQTDYDDKKAVARWVNAELREFGLAIKCPKTGLPATLVGHPGGDPAVGRYQLQIAEPGKPPRRTLSSVTLPHLELIPDVFGERSTAARRGPVR